MKEKYYEQYIEFEKHNPWYVARRALVLQLLKGQKKDSIIFDMGAGSGLNVSFLRKNGFKNVFGVEFSKEFIKYEAPFILNSSLAHIPLKHDSADIVLCLDVLEHLEHDKEAVREIARVLKKGGIAIITVPAIKSLWSVHDEINRHFRRYSSIELNALLKKELLVQRQTYWNFFLFLPIYIMKLFKRKGIFSRYEHDFKKRGRFIDMISLIIFKLENKLINLGISFPIGVSLVAIARSKK